MPGTESDATNSTTPNGFEIPEIPTSYSPVKVVFYGQAALKRPLSVVSCIQSGDLRVVPIIAIDFSMGNLTFCEDLSLHNPDPRQQNDYRDLMQLITQSYANVTNLAIFGFGAKTAHSSKKSTPMFPLTRSIRNPFTPNYPEVLNEMYTSCLKSLEMAVPIHLNPIVTFFKQLGVHVRQRIATRAKTVSAIKNSVDSVYVLYVLSTGLIDDVAAVVQTLSEGEWKNLPLQLQVISLAPSHISKED